MTRVFVDGIISTKDTLVRKKLDVIIMADENQFGGIYEQRNSFQGQAAG